MTKNDLLDALKVDLGITASAYDDRLKAYLDMAAEAIKHEGVVLNYGNIEHTQLIVMYAHWLWSKRDTGEGMPRMVRYQLNQLIFHQHLQDEKPEEKGPDEEEQIEDVK